ncbi:MAG: AbrB/MazE/SpoVT family DNA-binding domain-containing protein [Chloroflexi bacterium]|nr:AbrB/MazE/SpoVT family DNA-binding domain-containing protein [Chloroflexota bacterium]
MVESGVTSKGQTTLPKAVREALGVQPGDRVRYIIEGETVRIVAVRPIQRLFGALRYDGPTVSLEEMDQAIADGARRA